MIYSNALTLNERISKDNRTSVSSIEEDFEKLY